MVLVTSLTILAAAGGGLVFLGPGVPPYLFDALAVVGTLSAFVAICSTEAGQS